MDPATIALTFRRVLLSGILGLALLIPASVIPWPGSAATCTAASTHRVAVVVQHLDGATVSRCVPFTADTIGGEQALAGSKIQAGLLPSGGFGKAVCQLDNEPTTYPQTCWTGTSPFWALFVDHGGGWSYSSVGLSSIVLHDGDSLGFRYQSQSQHAAPSIPGDCPDPTSPPTTPKPTAKPTPPPTARPTPTPARTSTPAPPTGSPGVTAAPSTPETPPVPSATDGGVAAATVPPNQSPTSEPGGSLQSASTSAPAEGGTPPTPSGDAPLGLILVAAAGLAFAALGVVQVRRAR